jgi:bla regulator protein BlaR1
MIPESLLPVANHLWQSTVFAVAAGLMTLLLRKNAARVRHGVWVTASLKFLVPFSLLIALGNHVHLGARPVPGQNSISVALQQVSQPFTTPISSPLLNTVPARVDILTAVLWAAWACGFFGFAYSWWIRWRQIRAAVRNGSPLPLAIPIRAIYSPAMLEPGIFGVFRPVLLLPVGILDCLTPAQWRTVLAHELSHVRHRDNLVATIQMFVETVFWFNPFVWWIGRHMKLERERGCDEEVLQLGSEPCAYAQGILKICEFYLESPMACVAGVSGSDLRKRIAEIMKNRTAARLSVAEKAALVIAGAAALAVPVIVGIVNTPSVFAQEARPELEVASVKPSNSADPVFGIRISPGGDRFSITNATLEMLIGFAYRLPNPQISGGPKWVDSESFTIEAKVDSATRLSPGNAGFGQVMLMIQPLLADRFKLSMHKETRSSAVYELIEAKGGAKLKKAEADAKLGRRIGQGQVAGTMPLPVLAVSLSQSLDRPVVDRTGLPGNYTFTLTYTPEVGQGARFGTPASDAPPTDSGTSSIFTALREQLGLELKSTRAPVEVLVIDRAERPSEN